METSNKKKFTYSRLHSFIFCFSIVPIIGYIMRRYQGKEVDWISALIGAGIVLAGQIIAVSAFYKMETKDEMVQYCIAKANKITLYTVFAVLFAGLLLGNFMHGFVGPDFCWLTLCGAVALRSFLYTVFDNPSKPEEGE